MRDGEARRQALWPHGANMVLGAWLISSSATLGYQSPLLTWSDTICGVLLIVLSTLALRTQRGWLSWLMAAVGLWLMSAPLFFWAPTAAAYNNDTLIGALVVAFSVLVPGTPGAVDTWCTPCLLAAVAMLLMVPPVLDEVIATGSFKEMISGVVIFATPWNLLLSTLLGVWLMVAPWLLAGSTPVATWSNVFVGLTLILLSLPRGGVKERYGGWERFIV